MDGNGEQDSWDCVWAAICPGPAEDMVDVDGDDDVDLDDCRELLRGPAGPDGGGGGGDLGPGGDVDGDGVVNAEDNCVFAPNDAQSDIDLDGLGDPCDPDRDGDGFANAGDCWPDDLERFPGAGLDATCDGQDDDCDDLLDEDWETAACDTGEPGICAGGDSFCVNGVLGCDRLNDPVAEACDGLDNDCDGAADEEGPEGDLDDDGNGVADECELGHMTEEFEPEGSHPIWCGDGPEMHYRDYGAMTFDECDDLANRTGTQLYAGQAWQDRPGPGWIGHYDENQATIANRGPGWTRTERIPKDQAYTCRLAIADHRTEPDAGAWSEENEHVDAQGHRWHWWLLTNQTHSQCMSAADDLGGRLLNPWAVGQGRIASMAPPSHSCHAGPYFNQDGQGINSDQPANCHVGYYD
jgi:hypothetical protein